MPAPTLILSQDAGTDRDWQLVANGADGKPAVTLLATDTLAAVVWPGLDQPALFQPACAWVDPPAASWSLAITAAQSLLATPGRYQLRATVSRGGKTATILNAWWDLAWAAGGSASSPPVYGQFRDLERWVPWIGTLRAADDQAGFLGQRAEARAWLDDLILHAYPTGSAFGRFGAHSQAAINWAGGSLVVSRWLRDRLAAGALLATPKVVRVVSLYAAAMICRAQLGKKGENPHERKGASLYAEASARASTLTVELDTNGDGDGDIAVPLGVTNTRYA